MRVATPWSEAPWFVDLKGPFTLDGDCVEVQALTPDGKMVERGICNLMLDTTDWPNSKEAKLDAANARLIASAPQLASELQKLVAIICSFEGESERDVNIEDCDAAKALLLEIGGLVND